MTLSTVSASPRPSDDESTLPQGCADGSKESREASNSDYAWYVNLNNGNVNINNRNNSGLAVGCRRVSPSECQDVSFRELFDAYKKAKQHKVASRNQVAFEVRWMDGLLELQRDLNAGTWEPKPTVCFIATRPKAREIHAPDFSDRVVHHWLVPKLEARWEPRFIYDSYSNRSDKGTHAAVRRLTQFVRQQYSGEGDGFFLKIDIRNFFNCIRRPELYDRLKPTVQDLPLPAQWALHALLRRSPVHQGVDYRATPEERALVPPHKRLENAAPGCGLPIGNYSSQFLANVCMDELDQYVKHVLGVKRYLRYVDDMVLVHKDQAQLETWLAQIIAFLADRLKLRLKDDIELRPLSDGIDFLGYIIKPTRTTVRRRVISHAREKLSLWEQRHVDGAEARFTPADYRDLCSIWASYQGHFQHARHHHLVADFHRRYPWLAPLTRVRRRFHHQMEGQQVSIPLFNRNRNVT